MEVSIVVDSAAVRARLGQTPQAIDRALVAAMEDATSHLLRQMRVYPPPPTGSKYIRTDTLRGSWYVPRFTAAGADLVGRVVSSGAKMQTRSGEPYSRYVQDRDYQARIHQGRWTNTVQDVAERSTDAINAMFRARIDAAIGG